MMKIFKIMLAVTVLFFTSNPLLAVPTFQTYIVGSEAGDYNGDQDTWFTTDNPFELWAIGAYSSQVTSLTNVRLVVSVPVDQSGTISITGFPGSGTLDPSFIGAYSETSSFFPSGANFNSHYPLQDAVSNFLVYDLDPYSDVGDDIYDYNADADGSDPTLVPNVGGQVKEYLVEVSGFSWAHFDMYGLEGKGIDHKWKTSWDISPGSHDATFTPAPGAILLGGTGLVLVGWLRRRRTL